MQLFLQNESETKHFAKIFSKSLQGGEVVALIGELGAGKTTFVKALLAGAGVKNNVTSPTFTLMVPYELRELTYYHLDLYRTSSFAEVRALGIEELWGNKRNVLLIEWADKISRHLPKKSIILKFAAKKDGRELSIINAPATLTKMLK